MTCKIKIFATTGTENSWDSSTCLKKNNQIYSISSEMILKQGLIVKYMSFKLDRHYITVSGYVLVLVPSPKLSHTNL